MVTNAEAGGPTREKCMQRFLSGGPMQGNTFGESSKDVSNHQNVAELSVGLGKLDNVHRHLLKWKVSLDFSQRYRWCLVCLGYLAYLTGLYILFHCGVHSLPVVRLVKAEVCLLDSLVSGKGSIMVVSKHLVAKFGRHHDGCPGRVAVELMLHQKTVP